MKIKIQGFLGGNHSWAVTQRSLAHQFILLGHEVDLFSTNGLQYHEQYADLFNGRLKTNPLPSYDIQLSYTAMPNFTSYFSKGSKNRFGIWCYEWPCIPYGFAKYHQYVDRILAPSHFAKHCFISSKIPENKVAVVPHGVDASNFITKNKYPLKTNKSRKIFVNIGQAHARKNIGGMFEAYFKAFTNKDDVCLVAKISKNEMKNIFDVDPIKVLNQVRNKFKNAAEVELITSYVPNITELYNACDIVYTLSHCEGFYLPGIEALAAGKLNVAPRYGGQLDFLNDNNSLLIEGKMAQAPLHQQYWIPNIGNTHFESNIVDAVDKLRKAVCDYDRVMKQFVSSIHDTAVQYTWENAAKQIMNLSV